MAEQLQLCCFVAEQGVEIVGFVTAQWQHGAGMLRAYTCIDSEVGKAFWSALGWETDVATFSLYAMEEKTLSD